MDHCKEPDSTGMKQIQQFNFYYTNQQIQLLKVIFPYLSKEIQKTFAIYIKMMELQIALVSNSYYPYHCTGNTSNLINNLLEISTGKEKQTIESIKNTMETMAQIQETMETIRMMQDMFPEGSDMFNFENIMKEVMQNGQSNAGMDE